MIYKVIYGVDQEVGNLIRLQHNLYYLAFTAQLRATWRAANKVGTIEEVTSYCQQILGKGNGRFVKVDGRPDPKKEQDYRMHDLEKLSHIIQRVL